MSDDKSRLPMYAGIFITVTLTAFLLFAAPLAQIFLISHIAGCEGVTAYLQASDKTFYQFVLSALIAVAAVAGYLTYQSRKEARQEARDDVETLMRDMEKVFKLRFIEVFDRDMKKKKEEIEKLCEEMKAELENTICEVREDIGEKREKMDHITKEFEQELKDKLAGIPDPQSPAPDETDKEKEAREYLNNGISAYESGDFGKAIDLWTKAIELNKQYAEAYFNRGLARAKEGDHEKSIEDFSRRIEINEDNGIAYYNRGVVRVKKGDHKGAFEDFSRAIEINPEDARAYYNRGVIRGDEGNREGKIKDYSSAIKINPEQANAFFNRSCAYAQRKEVKECANDLRSAIKLDSKYLDLARKDSDLDPVRDEQGIIDIIGKPPYEDQ